MSPKKTTKTKTVDGSSRNGAIIGMNFLSKNLF